MSYHVRIEFPIRLVDQDVATIIKFGHFFNGTSTDDVEKSKAELRGDSGSGITYLEAENGSGDFPELEKILKKKKIPFDRFCGEGEGNSPELFYHRPDQNISRKVFVDMHGEAYMTETVLTRILENSRDLAGALSNWLETNTDKGINPIKDYEFETKAGSNADMMAAIDEVLKRLDNDEVSQTEAMRLIAEIKKKEGAQ